MTRRNEWRKAMMTDAFPQSERVIRGTLLCLVELMKSDGTLSVWRDQAEAVTGLPARTLDRHLARAVAAGWLVHEVQGGKRRKAIYSAAIPDGSVRHSRRTEAKFCAPSTRMPTPEFCAPPSGAHQRDRANDSERLAVNDHRGPRTTPDGSRAQRDHLHAVGSIDQAPSPIGRRINAAVRHP